MGSKSSSGGASQEFYDTMMDLSKQSQALGDIYNSIDLSGYRPGDAAHDLTDQYYKTGSYSADSTESSTSTSSAAQQNGMQNMTFQGQTYSFDPSTNRMYDSTGKEITNQNVIATVKIGGTQSDAGDSTGYGFNPNGKSVTTKGGTTTSNLGAAGLIPSITGGYDSTAGLQEASAAGPYSNYSNISAANENVQKEIAKIQAETAKTRTSNDGKPYKGADGKYYIDINGQTYDASSQGLNQLVTDTSFGLVKPTADLASETIQSQRDVLPSSTTSQISANNLLTAQNSATQGLVGDKTASEKAGYNYLTSRYNTDTNLEADREASTRLDYGAKNSLNQSTINQGDSRDSAAISGNYLTTDQNQAARRLVGDTETATRSGLKYQTAQNDSNTRLVPYNENASMADLQYKTDYSKGAAALLPKRFEATGKYIDESMKGIDVNTAMDEAGVDAARAFSNSQAAARKAAARSGVVANDSMFGSGAIAAAKASIGARALAKKNAQDENYKRLGAVALG